MTSQFHMMLDWFLSVLLSAASLFEIIYPVAMSLPATSLPDSNFSAE